MAAWLTSEYLEDALRQHYQKPQLRVESVDIKSALGKGENYGAVLTRIRIVFIIGLDGQVEEHLIAKTALEDEDAETRRKKAPYDIYNRELEIYGQVLPKLQRLAGEQLCPKVVHIDRQRGALIMEDLSHKGFVMAPRLQRLDEQHVSLVLRKLAKMQAASAVLEESSKSIEFSLAKYDRGFFNRYTESFSVYFLGCLMSCASYLKTQPSYEGQSKLLEDLAPHYMGLGLRCFQPEDSHINVLTHGDLWTNNMMFRYEEGVPSDVFLIDFQYAFWGSPTLDIHHLLNTSAVEQVRNELQMKMRCVYHDVFVGELRRLGFKGQRLPSRKQFHLESEQKRFYAVHCGLLLQPVLLNTDETDADFAALLSHQPRGMNMKRRLYLNPDIQDSIRQLVVQFELEGLLDPRQYEALTCYRILDRSYDVGWRQNFEIVLGRRRFWTFFSPTIASPLPNDGTQWFQRQHV
ncbi:uncharacterized protein LOC128252097 isoform X1 [Drosophila gunungcola]|uniref:uncharacterized protein LOC128252097 isoform X1 n=1 Tax=Drosophila gunungcola TaxID=103775 RepID=UPI0022E969BD|nr:uncharacterized protein LOC128252097 isoform X1 [Drosophila gunungcola]